MPVLATIVSVLAIAAVVAIWIVGARSCLQGLRAVPIDRQPRAKWLAALAWPFQIRRLREFAAAEAAALNKALVALFTCVMLAAVATSLATNLSRLPR
jgi:hypothetical protein